MQYGKPGPSALAPDQQSLMFAIAPEQRVRSILVIDDEPRGPDIERQLERILGWIRWRRGQRRIPTRSGNPSFGSRRVHA
jgi:hypothetical protein